MTNNCVFFSFSRVSQLAPSDELVLGHYARQCLLQLQRDVPYTFSFFFLVFIPFFFLFVLGHYGQCLLVLLLQREVPFLFSPPFFLLLQLQREVPYIFSLPSR